MSKNMPIAAAGSSPAHRQDISDVEDVELKTNTRPIIRLGFWVLVVGFGLFLAWAAWAPLDEGVSAPATVSVETRRKTIQHMQGGVIREVRVKEGVEVAEGDVLVVLDDGATRATMESIRQNYLSQRAHESRLLAEASGAASISFHSDLTSAGDAVSAQHMAVQTQLFNSRRAAQAAEAAAGEQSISGLEGQVKGVRLMLENRRGQQAIQARQAAAVKGLADEGFAPRNQALQFEQAQAELRSSLAELETSLHRTESGIAETRLRLAQRKQEYLKEVTTQLAEVRRDVQANQERWAAISAEHDRTQIKAPVAGQVIALAVGSVGGVVTPGQKLMDILPRGESLLLDVKIPTHVIDRIKVGDPTEVRFTAFANSPQLVVHAKLISLSGDAVTESIGGLMHTYYLGRVELTAEGVAALGNRSMQPGMQAEVLVRTGERPLLTYLLHPLIKRVASALTEE